MRGVAGAAFEIATAKMTICFDLADDGSMAMRGCYLAAGWIA
jgi:hypothetical protein